uniref:Uncharacterized protein n=1 Tax=Heterosigma akashiwo TaxID=2829 RepID=A0A7S3XWB4_HETAK
MRNCLLNHHQGQFLSFLSLLAFGANNTAALLCHIPLSASLRTFTQSNPAFVNCFIYTDTFLFKIASCSLKNSGMDGEVDHQEEGGQFVLSKNSDVENDDNDATTKNELNENYHSMSGNDRSGIEHKQYEATTTAEVKKKKQQQVMEENVDDNNNVDQQLSEKEMKKLRKKQMKEEKKAKREGKSLKLKPCELCEKPKDLLIRCTIDESGQWRMVCGKCWNDVSGGVTDGDADHPHYRYGGLWKARK